MRSLLLMVLIFAAAADVAPPDPQAAAVQRVDAERATAAALLHEVVRKYHALKSYQDSGESVLELREAPGAQPSGRNTIRFSTRFQRGGGYQFSMRTSDDYEGGELERARYCFWSDGRGPATLLEQFADEKPNIETLSLDYASAALTGVSQGTAHDVLRLLTDATTGFRIDALQHAHVVGDDTIDGVPVTEIDGRNGDIVVSLWIGREDRLLYRSAESHRDGSTETTTRRHLVLDADIPAAAFGACAAEAGPVTPARARR